MISATTIKFFFICFFRWRTQWCLTSWHSQSFEMMSGKLPVKRRVSYHFMNDFMNDFFSNHHSFFLLRKQPALLVVPNDPLICTVLVAPYLFLKLNLHESTVGWPIPALIPSILISVVAILSQCDRVRDDVLPDLGIRLEDKEGQPATIKMVDRDTLMKVSISPLYTH